MTCDEFNNACKTSEKLLNGGKTTFNEDKTMNNDQWKHRSKKMVCKSCMWFVLKVPENDKPNHLGRCRRHAPTMSGWPAIFETDWCGDHKLDENAVK